VRGVFGFRGAAGVVSSIRPRGGTRRGARVGVRRIGGARVAGGLVVCAVSGTRARVAVCVGPRSVGVRFGGTRVAVGSRAGLGIPRRVRVGLGSLGCGVPVHVCSRLLVIVVETVGDEVAFVVARPRGLGREELVLGILFDELIAD